MPDPRAGVLDYFFVSYRKSRDWPYGGADSREHFLELLTGGIVGLDRPVGTPYQPATENGEVVEIDRVRR